MPVSKGNRHTDCLLFSVQHQHGASQGNISISDTLTKLYSALSKASSEVSDMYAAVQTAMYAAVGLESVFGLIGAPHIAKRIGDFADRRTGPQRIANRVQKISITRRCLPNDLQEALDVVVVSL